MPYAHPYHIPVHRKLHLFLIVWYRCVNLVQLQTDFRIHIPPQAAANDPCSEIVEPILWIPQSDGEILRHMVQNNLQWMHELDTRLDIQDAVLEYHLLLVKCEVLRVSGTEK